MSRMDEETVKRYREGRCCGGCRHWHQWDFEREVKCWEGNPFNLTVHTESSLHFGDCDRIPAGTVVSSTFTHPDGTEGSITYKYDGYSFEDECYDEDMHCYEE